MHTVRSVRVCAGHATLCHGYDNNTYAHLRISPYKDDVTIIQIQMPFLTVGCSLVFDLRTIPLLLHHHVKYIQTAVIAQIFVLSIFQTFELPILIIKLIIFPVPILATSTTQLAY